MKRCSLCNHHLPLYEASQALLEHDLKSLPLNSGSNWEETWKETVTDYRKGKVKWIVAASMN